MVQEGGFLLLARGALSSPGTISSARETPSAVPFSHQGRPCLYQKRSLLHIARPASKRRHLPSVFRTSKAIPHQTRALFSLQTTPSSAPGSPSSRQKSNLQRQTALLPVPGAHPFRPRRAPRHHPWCQGRLCWSPTQQPNWTLSSPSVLSSPSSTSGAHLSHRDRGCTCLHQGHVLGRAPFTTFSWIFRDHLDSMVFGPADYKSGIQNCNFDLFRPRTPFPNFEITWETEK